MSQVAKKDHSTLWSKVLLRRTLLQTVREPVVLETHGGTGRLYQRCYSDVPEGIAFERDRRRAQLLARQRPTWAVYHADCVRALAAGVGAHLLVNVLDCDPWGDPWPALRAFFTSRRPRAQELLVVVQDGLRQKVQMVLPGTRTPCARQWSAGAPGSTTSTWRCARPFWRRPPSKPTTSWTGSPATMPVPRTPTMRRGCR